MYSIEYKEEEGVVLTHDGIPIAFSPSSTVTNEILIGMLNAQEITLKNLNFEIKPRTED